MLPAYPSSWWLVPERHTMSAAHIEGTIVLNIQKHFWIMKHWNDSHVFFCLSPFRVTKGTCLTPSHKTLHRRQRHTPDHHRPFQIWYDTPGKWLLFTHWFIDICMCMIDLAYFIFYLMYFQNFVMSLTSILFTVLLQSERCLLLVSPVGCFSFTVQCLTLWSCFHIHFWV